MSDELFKVVFHGEIAPDEDPGTVRHRLAERFRMSPERADALFTGKPVVIKRGLDEATAERLARAFREAGAICEVRGAGAAATTPARPADARTQNHEESAPAGPSGSGESAAQSGPDSPTTASAPAASASVADDDPNQTIVHLDVPADVSHLTLDDATPYTPPTDDVPAPDIDTSGLQVIEDDAPLSPPDESGPTPEIDTSGIELETGSSRG